MNTLWRSRHYFGLVQNMNTLQTNLVRTVGVAMKTGVDDAKVLAIGSSGQMFVKKIFCVSQSFRQNIKTWEGPVKTCLPLEVARLTDW